MLNVTATEMLKIHGEWIQGKDFIEKIGERRRVGDRQAFNILKKEMKEKKNKIIRHMTQDGKTFYGLAKFGPPPEFPNILVYYDVTSDSVVDMINKMTEQDFWEEIETLKEMEKYFPSKHKHEHPSIHLIPILDLKKDLE